MPATTETIAPTTGVGAVHLTVSDLERSLAYYERTVGLRVRERGASSASLGVGGVDLLVLVEEPGASPALGHTGLYHLALRVPERVDLARWLAHAARDRVPLVGLSDHFVSEAVYLADPDRHGIEIYWDRPREVWNRQVASRLTTLPLDVDGLLDELDDPRAQHWSRLPARSEIGHVHLRVAAVPEAIEFYRDVLGFELMAVFGGQAAFFGAGGYHHHVGANTWESRGASPPPPGTAALRHVAIVLPDAGERERVAARVADAGLQLEQHPDGPLVRDPSGNALVLTTPETG